MTTALLLPTRVSLTYRDKDGHIDHHIGADWDACQLLPVKGEIRDLSRHWLGSALGGKSKRVNREQYVGAPRGRR